MISLRHGIYPLVDGQAGRMLSPAPPGRFFRGRRPGAPTPSGNLDDRTKAALAAAHDLTCLGEILEAIGTNTSSSGTSSASRVRSRVRSRSVSVLPGVRSTARSHTLSARQSVHTSTRTYRARSVVRAVGSSCASPLPCSMVCFNQARARSATCGCPPASPAAASTRRWSGHTREPAQCR